MKAKDVKAAAELIDLVEKVTSDIDYINKAFGEPEVTVTIKLSDNDYKVEKQRHITYISRQEILNILGAHLSDYRAKLSYLDVEI